MTNQYNKNTIFEYNLGKKIRFIVYLLIATILIVGFSAYYYFFLSKMDNFFVNTINMVISHVASNIADTGSYLGAFYTTAIGGIFFILAAIFKDYFIWIIVGLSSKPDSLNKSFCELSPSAYLWKPVIGAP